MQRELVTIGDLGSLAGSSYRREAAPLLRSGARRRAMQGIGATIVGWSPPSGANMQSVGQPLQDAAIALQNYLDTHGVPAESTADSNVSAFQSAWNADHVAGVAPIDVDGGYGPNTYAALNALTGEAPPVGGGSTPAPIAPVGPSPVAPSSGSSTAFPWGTVLLVGGVCVGAYLILRKKKRSTTMISMHANPRRRRRKGARKGKRR